MKRFLAWFDEEKIQLGFCILVALLISGGAIDVFLRDGRLLFTYVGLGLLIAFPFAIFFGALIKYKVYHLKDNNETP